VDELWAVVVDYGGRASVALLDALLAGGASRVVLVDNALATAREVREERPGGVVWRIGFGANLGYGGALNRVLARAEAHWLLLANPDVVIEPEAMRALAATARAGQRVGLVAPILVDPEGRQHASVRRFPSLGLAVLHGALGLLWPGNPATRRYHLGELGAHRPVEAPWVSGALVLARTEALASIGGFDASYFLYLEDVDLAWRLWRAGWAVVVDPRVRAVHVGAGTTGQRPVRAAWWHARSLVRYGLAQEGTLLGQAAVVGGVAARGVLAAGIGVARRAVVARTASLS